MKTLDIIVPVYNEEDCIDKTLERLLNYIDRKSVV